MYLLKQHEVCTISICTSNLELYIDDIFILRFSYLTKMNLQNISGETQHNVYHIVLLLYISFNVKLWNA